MDQTPFVRPFLSMLLGSFGAAGLVFSKQMINFCDNKDRDALNSYIYLGGRCCLGGSRREEVMTASGSTKAVDPGDTNQYLLTTISIGEERYIPEGIVCVKVPEERVGDVFRFAEDYAKAIGLDVNFAHDIAFWRPDLGEVCKATLTPAVNSGKLSNRVVEAFKKGEEIGIREIPGSRIVWVDPEPESRQIKEVIVHCEDKGLAEKINGFLKKNKIKKGNDIGREEFLDLNRGLMDILVGEGGVGEVRLVSVDGGVRVQVDAVKLPDRVTGVEVAEMGAEEGEEIRRRLEEMLKDPKERISFFNFVSYYEDLAGKVEEASKRNDKSELDRLEGKKKELLYLFMGEIKEVFRDREYLPLVVGAFMDGAGFSFKIAPIPISGFEITLKSRPPEFNDQNELTGLIPKPYSLANIFSGIDEIEKHLNQMGYMLYNKSVEDELRPDGIAIRFETDLIPIPREGLVAGDMPDKVRDKVSKLARRYVQEQGIHNIEEVGRLIEEARKIVEDEGYFIDGDVGYEITPTGKFILEFNVARWPTEVDVISVKEEVGNNDQEEDAVRAAAIKEKLDTYAGKYVERIDLVRLDAYIRERFMAKNVLMPIPGRGERWNRLVCLVICGKGIEIGGWGGFIAPSGGTLNVVFREADSRGDARGGGIQIEILPYRNLYFLEVFSGKKWLGPNDAIAVSVYEWTAVPKSNDVAREVGLGSKITYEKRLVHDSVRFSVGSRLEWFDRNKIPYGETRLPFRIAPFTGVCYDDGKGLTVCTNLGADTGAVNFGRFGASVEKSFSIGRRWRIRTAADGGAMFGGYIPLARRYNQYVLQSPLFGQAIMDGEIGWSTYYLRGGVAVEWQVIKELALGLGVEAKYLARRLFVAPAACLSVPLIGLCGGYTFVPGEKGHPFVSLKLFGGGFDPNITSAARELDKKREQK